MLLRTMQSVRHRSKEITCCTVEITLSSSSQVSKRSSSSFVIFEGQFSMLAPSVNKMLLLRLQSQTISDESVSYSCYNMLLFMPNTPCKMHFRSKRTYTTMYKRTNEWRNKSSLRNAFCIPAWGVSALTLWEGIKRQTWEWRRIEFSFRSRKSAPKW